MAAREYDSTLRRKRAEETRQSIIDAAHRLLDTPDGTLSLQEVAAAAGTSRASIYNRVGSRRQLLAAVFEDQGRIIEYDRVLAAMRLDDPRVAVTETVRESCRAWDVIPAAIRRTLALATADSEVRELVRTYEQYRQMELRSLAERVVAAGLTVTDSTVDHVTAVLTVVTGFHAYDQLRITRSARVATEVLVAMARSSLNSNLRMEDESDHDHDDRG